MFHIKTPLISNFLLLYFIFKNDHGYKGNKKIHFSGPLGAVNVDQMLKDHDRHIQEAARRARLDKTRLTKVESEALTNPIYMSSRRAR